MNAKDLIEILSEVHDDCIISHNVYSIQLIKLFSSYDLFYRITTYDGCDDNVVLKCRYMNDSGSYSTLEYDGEVWVDEHRRDTE